MMQRTHNNSVILLILSKLPFIFIGIFLPYIASANSNLPDQFNPDRAFEHVKRQVEFGPRPSGSQELQKTRDYISAQLKSYGLEVIEQSFEADTPKGKIRFVNIISRPPSSTLSKLFKSKPKLIFASHYDTKWLPKIRFVGANDAGSSTAVLIELARVISEKRFKLSNATIEFIFFDGEEAIESYSDKDGLYGSRHYVEKIKHDPKTIQGVILIDMIGDKKLSVQIPDGDSELTKAIFKASEALGYRDHFHPMLRPMVDDHVPFLNAKIPAINLIDFDYGPINRFWHTEEDSIDKISPQSLKIVGQTLLKYLETHDTP